MLLDYETSCSVSFLLPVQNAQTVDSGEKYIVIVYMHWKPQKLSAHKYSNVFASQKLQ